MADVDAVRIRDALWDLVEVFETHGSVAPPPAVNPPALGLSLLEPGRFEDVFAAARNAQTQLPFEIPPSGRVVLVCAEPLIPWLAACGWGLEAARAGATVTVACPFETHSMAALFVALGSSLPWRRIDHYRFDTTDWRVFVATIQRIGALDMRFVHAEEGQSSAWALERAASTGGIVVTHPEDGHVLGGAPPDVLILQPLGAPWPPTGPRPGDRSLRSCAGQTAQPFDRIIGVGLLDPFDGVLIGEAPPAEPNTASLSPR